MTHKSVAIGSALLILAMVAAGAVAAGQLPPDAQLPVHWGITGQPDRWAGKWSALMMMPGFTAGVALLLGLLPRLEPMKEGLARSGGFYVAIWVGMMGLFALLQLAIVGQALGYPLSMPRLCGAGIGLLWILIGDQLAKTRRMALAGIRTPWTLASEEVWIGTHRLGGKLFVASGIAILAAALLLPPAWMFAVMMVTTLGAAGVTIVYSQRLYRRVVDKR